MPALKRFELLRPLGSGGMGVVYEARDRARGHLVALKTLTTIEPESLLRFKTEFRALQDLHHPNLVQLYDLVEEEGQWYFTMELVRGVSFIDWVRPGDAGQRARTEVDGAMQDDVTADLSAASRSGGPGAHAAPIGGRFDEARLRASLVQVADALCALHTAHKVHCDIKPANVLVTDEERAVVLDFGIIVDTLRAASGPTKIIGTAAFMAPEQAAMQAVGAAADWYSLGVMLYLSLTGRLPFSGTSAAVLDLKQRFEPIPADVIVPDLPRDLAQLASDLLRRDPAARPDGREVLHRLCRHAAAPATVAVPAPERFVGRRDELRALRAHFARTRSQGAVVALRGESGIGKSALIARLVSTLERDGAVVLAGRCYQRETVPFKAVDELMDALSRDLLRRDEAAISELTTRDVGLLAHVFPTMRRIPGWSDVVPDVVPVDPRYARSLVFTAFRHLMRRLAQKRPLVIIIDDVQWADADSLSLLAELMRAPAPTRLMLLLALRDGSDADAQIQALQHSLPDTIETLTLAPLSREESNELATSLLQGAADAATVRRIVDDASGHPMFVEALVRWRSLPTPHHERATLDDALWARCATASGPARQVLELLSIAHVPLAASILEEACGLDAGVATHALAELRALKLVRVGSGDETVEPYHDRIRRAVRSHIAEPAPLHRRLATTLETRRDAQPEALAVHWAAAGERERAVGHAATAATQAAAALAFERAARLAQMALDLLAADDPRRPALLVQRADALANAGRGGDGGDAFLVAAEAATEPAEALTLRRRAAEQYLASGRIDDGLDTLQAVLRALGLALPRTPRRALLSLLWQRARIRLRGSALPSESQKSASAAELARVDACWSVAVGLGLVDTIRGAESQGRHLLLALRTGDRFRIARALSAEACYCSTGGVATRVRTDSLLESALRLSLEIGDPRAIGFARGAAGIVAVQQGRWRVGKEHCEAAEQILRARCQGVAWEIFTAQYFKLAAMSFLGDIAKMQDELPAVLRQARERGDLNAITSLEASLTNIVWLAADQPEQAREQAAQALRTWSRQGYQMQHYYSWHAQAQAGLYSGDGASTFEHVLRGLGPVERSLLTRVQLIRITVSDVAARAALAAARQCDAGERKRRLAIARRFARRIERERAPWALGHAELLYAQLAWADDDRVATVRWLESAAARFEAEEMRLCAAVARRVQGRIVGGDVGAGLVTGADALLHAQRVRRGDRISALFAPGFVELG